MIRRPNTFTRICPYLELGIEARSVFFCSFHIKLNFQLIVVNKNQWFQGFLVSFTVLFRFHYFLTTMWRTSSLFSSNINRRKMKIYDIIKKKCVPLLFRMLIAHSTLHLSYYYFFSFVTVCQCKRETMNKRIK